MIHRGAADAPRVNARLREQFGLVVGATSRFRAGFWLVFIWLDSGAAWRGWGRTRLQSNQQPHNKALHPTAYSLRSFLAPAFGGG